MEPVTQSAVCYNVPAFANLAILAGATAGPFTFTFPRPVFVESMLVIPRAGTTAIAALLEIAISDENQQQIFADGQNDAFTPLLQLQGQAFNRFPVQRPLAALDKWLISITNNDAATQTVAALMFFFRDQPGVRV